MSVFISGPFSNSTGTAPDGTRLPAPRIGNEPISSFASVFDDVRRAEAPERADSVDASVPLAQLMKMLWLLELLGLPAPRWLIDAFRAHGMGGLATSLEARNLRIEHERVEEELRAKRLSQTAAAR